MYFLHENITGAVVLFVAFLHRFDTFLFENQNFRAKSLALKRCFIEPSSSNVIRAKTSVLQDSFANFKHLSYSQVLL